MQISSRLIDVELYLQESSIPVATIGKATVLVASTSFDDVTQKVYFLKFA